MTADDRYRVSIEGGRVVMDMRAPLDMEWSVPAGEVLTEGRAADWIRSCMGEDELARIRELIRSPPPPPVLPVVEAVDGLVEPLRAFALDLAVHFGVEHGADALRLRAWTMPERDLDRSTSWSEHLVADLDDADHCIRFMAQNAYWHEGARSRSTVHVHAWARALASRRDIVAEAVGPLEVTLAVVADDVAAVTRLLEARLGPVGARVRWGGR
ncbi:MAG: hypothetical protein IPL61_29145 [Myxococcales bacterium]|nr:hypothetical protein [Myxococcales bacterium]